MGIHDGCAHTSYSEEYLCEERIKLQLTVERLERENNAYLGAIGGLKRELEDVREQLAQLGICAAWTGAGGKECGKCYECMAAAALHDTNRVANERDAALRWVLASDEERKKHGGQCPSCTRWGGLHHNDCKLDAMLKTR